MRILKVQANGPLPKRAGSKPEYPKKTPNNQSENRYHVIIRGEIHHTSNIGDKFVWSERAGSDQWLPPCITFPSK